MNPRDAVRTALVMSDDLHEVLHAIEESVGRLVAEKEDALRRAHDAQKRSEIDQQQADDMTKMAGRAALLEKAGKELVETLDRLPLRMEDAGMKQMVVPPEIPLYGTHDWDAVEQAKRRLVQLFKQEE